LLHLLEHGTGTADDVRSAVTLPQGINPVCLGSVPSALARAGIIRRVGFAPCVRVERHAAPTSVWAIVDAAKAWVWLAEHPDSDDTPSAQYEMFPENEKPLGATSGGLEGNRYHARSEFP
jgi:hypothetical protein